MYLMMDTGLMAPVRGWLGRAERLLIIGAVALAGWTSIGAPYEAAVARPVLGRARQQWDRPEAARMEWQAAATAFDQFGAEFRQAEAQALLRGARPPSQISGPAPVSIQHPGDQPRMFRCQGDTRTITFEGETVLLRDLVGFRYLERLLAEPGRELHVLDLVAMERGSLPPAGEHDRQLDADPAHAGELLDNQAREAYRRRPMEVEADIEEAEGGRARLAGDTSERARTSVTRSIRYALAKIADHHRPLANHLEQTIRTGTCCAYQPGAPLAWTVR